MQQSPTVMPAMPSFPPTNITTEQIQKYLDENKKLILAILDNQNLGKLAECAQYQAHLQKNLMYLAAIADAQPQVPSPMAAAAAPHPAMQQGGYYMHPQSAAMAQQPPGFSPKMQMQFASPHQLHQHQQQQQYLHQQQQQQQAMQGQLNMRPGGPGNGMHSMQSEAALGGGGSGGQNRQSPSETGHSSDVPGSSAGGNGGGDVKGTEEGK